MNKRNSLIKEIKGLCELAKLRHSQVKTVNLKLDMFCSWKVLEVVLKEVNEFPDVYNNELLESIVKEYQWVK